eukprot:scaffold624_cov402-Prasinococcus_capsulatus_cf.AAC.51
MPPTPLGAAQCAPGPPSSPKQIPQHLWIRARQWCRTYPCLVWISPAAPNDDGATMRYSSEYAPVTRRPMEASHVPFAL